MDIYFASTRIRNELFQLRLQFLDWFLLFTTHGESELLCDYNEIMHRYCHCITVLWGRRAISIQSIKGGSLLLLLVSAVKKREGLALSFLRRMKKRGYKEWYQGTMESKEIKSKRNIRRKRYQKCLQWKKMTPTLGFSFGRIYFKKRSLLLSVLELKNNLKNLKINFKQI